MDDGAPVAIRNLREPGLTSGRGSGFLRQYELVERVLAYQPDADEDALNRAYVFAMVKHGEQKRHSGDPYYAHPVSVAGLLTDLRLDQSTIMAGLLHDTVEDTDVTLSELAENFGGDVAELVDGVTKLTRLEGASHQIKQAENFQKFILATAKDIRVLLVKLADRLHNMRTIEFMPRPESRLRVSRETMDIYAPLARRVGLSVFAAELEDLAFSVINPDARTAIEKRLQAIAESSDADVERIRRDIGMVMAAADLGDDVRGRLKRPYSIWRKLEAKSVSFRDLGDIFAFRLVVPTETDCYRALGVAHQHWAALSDRFKDYISVPKPNGYRSLHTTFRGSGNVRVELQIRTPEMDAVAERGVAAHWRYKNESYGFDSDAARAAGLDAEASLTAFADMLAHGAEPEEFLEHAKLEMYRDAVFAFTPKGRLVKLPAGATPLDFAYSVHTKVGDTCVGARVNGDDRPLRTILRNGDVVEIIRGPAAAPPPNWEGLAVTGRARSAIRRLTRTKEREEFVALGRSLMDHGLRRIGMEPTEVSFAAIGDASEFASRDDMLEAVGRGRVSARKILASAFPAAEIDAADGAVPRVLDDDNAGGLVAGEDLTPGVTLRLAECCSPLPGDRIVGVLKPETGVEVHVIDCRRLADFEHEADRWVDLRWRRGADDVVAVARILVTTINQRGVLALLCKTVSDALGNITNVAMTRRSQDFFDQQFDIEVEDAKHLTQILAALRALKVVDSAERVRG